MLVTIIRARVRHYSVHCFLYQDVKKRLTLNQHRDEDQLCAGEKDAFSGFIFTTAYVVFITAKRTLIFIHTIHKLA